MNGLGFAMHKEGREVLTQAMIIQAGRSIRGFIVVPASVRIQEVIYTFIVQIETSRTRVAIVIGSCQSTQDKLRCFLGSHTPRRIVDQPVGHFLSTRLIDSIVH